MIPATAPQQRGSREGRIDPLTLAAAGALGLVTLVATFVGDGNPALALAPLLLTLLLLAITQAPLRWSLLALAFLSMTLENPSEATASGLWRSPLYVVGALLLAHINVTIPVKAFIFSGLDLVLLLLAGLWAWRRMSGSTIDIRGHVPPAPPMRAVAFLCLAGIALVWGFGMVRPGFSFANSLWQVFRVVYLPLVFLLFCAGLRGPGDAKAMGVVLVAAALLRAVAAVYIRQLFPDKELMPHTTTHADSMLFANAVLLVLANFTERRNWPSLRLVLLTTPVLIAGMVANNRRLVWVELLLGVLALYVITPWTWLKRRIAQTVALSIPVLVLYVAVGWNAASVVFAPVRTIRSVVDSKADTSTLWRDWENYNLYFTLKGNPLLGTGYGHEYIEAIHLPDISGNYSLYRYAPHNSILGLLAYSGLLGFALIWSLVPAGIFFSVRAYRYSVEPRDRVAALTAVCAIITYALHCYGDMALGTWTSVFTIGPALALMAKLAVANGAWPLGRAPPPAGAPR